MARDILIPGGGIFHEDGTDDVLIPSGGVFSEDQAAVAEAPSPVLRPPIAPFRSLLSR